MFDFGVELPAWFEFDSRDNISAAALTMAIGEYDQPWQDTGANNEDFSWKLGPPHAFTGSVCDRYTPLLMRFIYF